MSTQTVFTASELFRLYEMLTNTGVQHPSEIVQRSRAMAIIADRLKSCDAPVLIPAEDLVLISRLAGIILPESETADHTVRDMEKELASPEFVACLKRFLAEHGRELVRLPTEVLTDDPKARRPAWVDPGSPEFLEKATRHFGAARRAAIKEALLLDKGELPVGAHAEG